MRRAAAIAATLLASAALAQHHGQGHGAGPYAGQQLRDIKALSEEEVKGYLAGAGMGLAKAAELNGYPGPMHTLEHAEALNLTEQQRAAMQSLLAGHKAEARTLGAEVVRLERELDQLFARRKVSAEVLDLKLVEIAAAQAKLRGSHLRTHLVATRLLEREQIARYVQLRGYGAHASHGHGGH